MCFFLCLHQYHLRSSQPKKQTHVSQWALMISPTCEVRVTGSVPNCICIYCPPSNLERAITSRVNMKLLRYEAIYLIALKYYVRVPSKKKIKQKGASCYLLMQLSKHHRNEERRNIVFFRYSKKPKKNL